MLIDSFAPEREFSLVRTAVVEADSGDAMAAVMGANLLASPVPRVLMWVRDLPNRVVARLKGVPLGAIPAEVTFGDIAQEGPWQMLAGTPDREFVAGAIGRFWQRDYGWVDVDVDEFGDYDEPDHAKTLVSFRLEPYGSSRTLIVYESRTVTTDEQAHRRFRWYWLALRPFFGVMMASALTAIRREAEGTR